MAHWRIPALQIAQGIGYLLRHIHQPGADAMALVFLQHAEVVDLRISGGDEGTFLRGTVDVDIPGDLSAVFRGQRDALSLLMIPELLERKNSRKHVMAGQISLFDLAPEEEKERFLISVYKSYVGDGIINQDDYEAKCKKCVNLMEDNEDDVIAKYSKKKKQVNLIDNKSDEYSQEVTKLVNDIEEIIK
jgi:hypothetical protein